MIYYLLSILYTIEGILHIPSKTLVLTDNLSKFLIIISINLFPLITLILLLLAISRVSSFIKPLVIKYPS